MTLTMTVGKIFLFVNDIEVVDLYKEKRKEKLINNIIKCVLIITIFNQSTNTIS